MQVGIKVTVQIHPDPRYGTGRFVSAGGATISECLKNLKASKYSHLKLEELKAIEKAWRT